MTTTSARRVRSRPVARTVACLAGGLCLTVTACTDGDGGAQPTVTVTAPTAPEATGASTDGPADGSTEGATAASDEGAGSEVGDRTYDVGAVVDVTERETESGTQRVLLLDRYTVVGVDDAVLATEGVDVVPHTGGRFTNQNAERTYQVPVADDAAVVLSQCRPPTAEGGSAGLSSQQVDLDDFLELPGREGVVVFLRYSGGEMVSLETDPLC